MPEPLLSLVVNTFQAEKYLEECLASAAGVADEIVVVDMHSDDATRDIARRFTDRIYLHPRTGYVEPARNFALEQARGRWALVLDADERLSPSLARGLRPLLESDDETAAFLVPRENYAAGRWLQGTGWSREDEQHLRLFRRGKARWSDRIHTQPLVDGPVRPLPLPHDAAIIHLNFPTLEDFVARLPVYSAEEARALQADGARWSPEAMLGAAREEVMRRYQPAVDGTHSLVFSGMMAFYRFLAWARLWELQGCPDAPLPAEARSLLEWFARGGPASPGAPAEIFEGVFAIAGVHRDEGGYRWLGREALLRVTGLLAGRPSWLHLTLARPTAEQLAGAVVIDCLADDRPVAAVRLEEDAEMVSLRIPLPAFASGFKLRIRSSASFRPVADGSSDDGRELAVRLHHLSVHERALI